MTEETDRSLNVSREVRIIVCINWAEFAEEGANESTFWAIFKEARPEWFLLFLAVVSASIQGCVFPAFSIFFTQIIEVPLVVFPNILSCLPTRTERR